MLGLTRGKQGLSKVTGLVIEVELRTQRSRRFEHSLKLDSEFLGTTAIERSILDELCFRDNGIDDGQVTASCAVEDKSDTIRHQDHYPVKMV